VRFVLQVYAQHLDQRIRQLVKSGEADQALKLLDKAIGAVDTVAAEHPSGEELYRAVQAKALNSAAWFLVTCDAPELRDPARAVELARQAVARMPDRGSYLNTLGVAQYRAGRWQDAATSLAKSEELTHGENLAFNGFFLAMAHWQLGHKDEARTWYDRSV